MPNRILVVLGLAASVAWPPSSFAANGSPNGQLDARLMRQADVSATQIAFVYAGDIWVAPKSGGTAVRLSSPRGEESFPRFSPDGSQIAFSGNYDGNTDIYVVPAAGGLPQRVTYHGAADRVVNWYPDGKHILFASLRESPRDRFNQFYKIPAQGGLPEKLPVPYGEFGAISPDGRTLAYTPISVDFRTWKRYRGGMNPDIWLFDLETREARNLTQNPAEDAQPMWHGTTLYFLSDRDENKRANIWACDTTKNTFRQVTFFQDYDVHFPSAGPDDLVFEAAGRLYLLNFKSQKYAPVEITVVTDRATLKPRTENVSKLIDTAGISPTGKRAIFDARGEIFTVPAENGVVRSLTRNSGAAERYPGWSPDAKWIAYFSDASGEYELCLRPADGSGAEQKLTSFGAGFRYRPQWSPDSKKIVFIDKAMKVHLHDLDKKKTTMIGSELWMYQGELNGFRVGWSADSRWIAWAHDQTNRNSAIYLHDTRTGKGTQVTSGFYNDEEPTFDPDGKYLFFKTGRSFQPIYSELDPTWIYANTVQLAAVPLRKDAASPLAPRNDDEPARKEEEKKSDSTSGEKKSEPAEAKKGAQKLLDKPEETPAAKPEAKSEEKPAEKAAPKKDAKPKAVEIDLDGFEQRVVILPTKAGRYAGLTAVAGKLVYHWLPRTGSTAEKSPIEYFDLEKREVKTVVDDANMFRISADGKKMLVRKANDYFIIDVKDGQKLEKKLATADLETTVDPVAEWRQIFNDVWRLERDCFYDPHLHGVDWKAMRERYGKLLADCVTRWDVSYVIGELISELNASHTYRSGGDTENAPTRGVGYLGCDFALDHGAFRIKRILDGAPWDAEVRSPLRQPGVKVKEGDYLLAVNGKPLHPAQEPWAALQGLANKPVFLSVNDKPELKGARDVLVQTLDAEMRLRNLAWIEENRRRVEKLSGGKIGYVYVPNTGQDGQTELVRQLRGQTQFPGLVVDERFNSGGQIPDRFIELLNRPVINYWAVRDGKDWQWPPVGHAGPKAMLMNGWSGSGGDCFPFYFKKAGLGPLIGMRTWGGLIGITGAPPLIDGGSVTVPTFGIYSTNGEWIIEG
ncbi:MAG TPA: PDZ domain-containing protein, partial [Verrucomicrobiae bacterium]